jgi:hypothetical protein
MRLNVGEISLSGRHFSLPNSGSTFTADSTSSHSGRHPPSSITLGKHMSC